MLVEFQQTRIFSSAEEDGASNVTKSRTEFDVLLNTPILIPQGAINPTIEVVNAAIWYVSPNISADYGNNRFSFTEKGINYNWVLPDGLYSLTDINNWLAREFAENGLPENLVFFGAEGSTQRVVMSLPYADCVVHFSVADSLNNILGFAQQDFPPAGTSLGGESYTAEDPATLNRLNRYLIHCSLTADGIAVNDIGSNIVSDIAITTATPPGSQLVYSPFNPLRAAIDNMVGMPVSSVHMRLTDQNSRHIDMLGEDWSCTVVMRYHLQVSQTGQREHYSSSKHHRGY